MALSALADVADAGPRNYEGEKVVAPFRRENLVQTRGTRKVLELRSSVAPRLPILRNVLGKWLPIVPLSPFKVWQVRTRRCSAGDLYSTMGKPR